jgi:serine-type D-Ala-D-Ala carboxypeptidase (penicillin-binding protein 5/6)
VKRLLISGPAKFRRVLAGALACLISALAAAAASTAGAAPVQAATPGASADGGTTVIGGRQLSGRGVIVNYPAYGAPRLPAVPAYSYVIADAGTGKVLAAKDPHGWFDPASTLKVLTAITLMPVLNPDATVVASRMAADVEPSKVGLVAGQRYTVADLFQALLLISANDAAISLVQATGSFAKGVAMMNTEARHLRADDTVARQPNGLDAPGQHVSAYDEALFARQALKMPMFMQDDEMLTARFPLRPHHVVTLYNQDSMLTKYPGDLGGKIGWTTAAGATYVGFARRGGVTLIVTLLHCPPLTETTYAARLLNWGFAVDGKIRPVGRLVRPEPAGTARRRAKNEVDARSLPASRSFSSLPADRTVPVAAGAAALVLAAAVGGLAVAVSRRRQRAGNRPFP